MWVQINQKFLHAFLAYGEALHFGKWIAVHAREVGMVFCSEGTTELVVKQGSLYLRIAVSDMPNVFPDNLCCNIP